MTVRLPRLRLAWALALLASGLTAMPGGAHGGRERPVRPVVAGVEPAVAGLSVEVVYSGAWELRLENATPVDVTVLDRRGVPFLRIGPSGVSADVASAAWYESNSPDGVARPPQPLDPAAVPDFRPVARAPAWTWFDPRLTPGPLPDRLRGSARPARLGDWEVPVRYGERAGRLHGHLEYEPFLGTYRHRLTSSPAPAPGLEVSLVTGRAVPALRLENASAEPVTVLGPAEEPFARIGADVEVNLHSPAWQEIARSEGLTPTVVADAAAAPQWRLVLNGSTWSWPEFRGRPPQLEPTDEVVAGGEPVVVTGWRVPLRVGELRPAIEGVTEFVPAPAEAHRPVWPTVALGVTAAVLLALSGIRSRRGRRPS